MGDGESKTGDVIGCQGNRFKRHIIESGRRGGELNQRTALILSDVAHRRVLPGCDADLCRHFQPLVAHGLAQREGDASGGLGHVFAEDNDRIRCLNLRQGGSSDTAITQRGSDCSDRWFFCAKPGTKVLGFNEGTEHPIGFQRSAGRPDTGDSFVARAVLREQCQCRSPRNSTETAVMLLLTTLLESLAAVDEVSPKTTAITEEVPVHLLVISVVDSLKSAVTFARRDIAANAATDTDGGRRL